jgi:hypothetical protein
VPQFVLEQLSNLRMQGALKVEVVAQNATIKVAATTRRVLKLASGDTHRLATDVPYSLELMVSKSFEALEEPVRLTVQTAATIGTAFATEAVVDSHPDQLSTAEVEAHLEAMQKYGFLRPRNAAERWTFCSNSIHTVLFWMLPTEFRKRCAYDAFGDIGAIFGYRKLQTHRIRPALWLWRAAV